MRIFVMWRKTRIYLFNNKKIIIKMNRISSKNIYYKSILLCGMIYLTKQRNKQKEVEPRQFKDLGDEQNESSQT